MRSTPKQAGTVAFVGAGPGDPALLTLRAAELLGRADVVVTDTTPVPGIARLFRDGATVVELSSDGDAERSRTPAERAKAITEPA
jgi:uroporphyrinogen III methyltransferase/synthase